MGNVCKRDSCRRISGEPSRIANPATRFDAKTCAPTDAAGARKRGFDNQRVSENTLHFKGKGLAPSTVSPLLLIAGTNAGLVLFYDDKLYAGLGFDEAKFRNFTFTALAD